MSDPLTEVVHLLQPRAVLANPISGKGNWAVRFPEFGQPSFCIMLEGACLLAVDGHAALTLGAGDFVLLPKTPAFTISSFAPAMPVHLDPRTVGGHGEVRYGEPGAGPDMRSLGGAFMFGESDPALLVSLLPDIVHVRGSGRLARLVEMVGEEYEEKRPGNEFMLSRLTGMMLIEAMRATGGADAPPGLLRGLADERLAAALRQMHADVSRAWTVTELARAAALSRSAFFDRFTRTVGVAPMEYLLGWRMEMAKRQLRGGASSIAEIAERIGYASTSTFSTAFSRYTGLSPRRYAQLAPSGGA